MPHFEVYTDVSLDPKVFVKALEDDSICQICELVLEDVPNLICGHSYHRKCLESWINTGRRECPSRLDSCPALPDLAHVQDIHILNTRIQRSEIRCPHADEGCRKRIIVGVKRQGLIQHLESECAFQTANCPFCQHEIGMAQLQQHQRHECVRRPIRCRHCGIDSTFAAMQVSHPIPGDCPMLVECPLGCSAAASTTQDADDGEEAHRKRAHVPVRILKHNVALHTSQQCVNRKITCTLCAGVEYRASDLLTHQANIAHITAERDRAHRTLEHIAQVTNRAEVHGLELRPVDGIAQPDLLVQSIQRLANKTHELTGQLNLIRNDQAKCAIQLEFGRFLHSLPPSKGVMKPYLVFAHAIDFDVVGLLGNGMFGPGSIGKRVSIETKAVTIGAYSFKLMCERDAASERASVFLQHVSGSLNVQLDFGLWVHRHNSNLHLCMTSKHENSRITKTFTNPGCAWGLKDTLGFADVWGRGYDIQRDSITIRVLLHTRLK